MPPFPVDNVVGKSKIDRTLIKSEKWDAAKRLSGVVAARKIVSGLWSDEKTHRLKQVLSRYKDVVLISQPSTSGTNVIPIVFGDALSRSLDASFVIGDQHFNAGHYKEVKAMTVAERTFERRIYVPQDEKIAVDIVSGKNIVIVEDILTSGASAAEFTRCIQDSGGKVVSVAALMGDRRLNLDPKTKDRLESLIEEKRLGVSVDALSRVITRTQAGRMIQLINQVGTDHAKAKITERIQGLLDRRPFKGMGRNPEPGRYPGADGNDLGHERISENIQPGAIFEAGGNREFKIIVTLADGQLFEKRVSKNGSSEDLSRLAKKFALSTAVNHHLNSKEIGDMKIAVKGAAGEERRIVERQLVKAPASIGKTK